MPSALPRRLLLPRRDRAHWQAAADEGHDLQYLAWGERRFGDAPLPCTRHDGWVFAVCEAGQPWHVTENARRRFSAGTALIMGPDHAYGWADSTGKKCRMLLWMWRRPVTRWLGVDRDDGWREIRLEPERVQRLQLLHALCREEVRLAGPAMPDALRALQALLETTLARPHAPQGTHSQAGQRLELAQRWMESHLDSPQPAARLADYLGVSVSTLYRIFQSELGHSPDEHFHALKMQAARRQLETGAAVKAVAFRLGYRHPGDLSRAYQRHFGVAPLADRTAKARRPANPIAR